MLIDEAEVLERVSSPLNLLNRLRSITKTEVVSLPPSIDKIVPNVDKKLARETLQTKAAKIMDLAMDELELNVKNIQKPEKLAQIAEQMSRVISNQNEKPNQGQLAGQLIIYAPQIMSEEQFDAVVGE